MRYLASLLAIFLVAGAAYAQTLPASGACVAVNEISFPGYGQGGSFTTPPYVALEPTGELQRLARRSHPLQREIPLTEAQSACLETITGARLTALRAGESYTFKLQAPTRTVLIFHVANLIGGEALVSTRGQRLLAEAESLQKAGRQVEAANIYQAVIQADVPQWEVAVAYAALGKIEKEEGLIENALDHVSQALVTYPRLYGALAEKTNLEEAVARLQAQRREERRTSLLAQIDAFREEGRSQEAIPLAKEAIELAEETFGPDSTEYAGHLDVLAELHETVGQFTEAEPLYTLALAIREEALGVDHPEAEESRQRLAALAERLAQAEEALASAEEVSVTRLSEETNVDPSAGAEEEVSPWLEPVPVQGEEPAAYVDGGTLAVGLGKIVDALAQDDQELEVLPATQDQSDGIEMLPILAPDNSEQTSAAGGELQQKAESIEAEPAANPEQNGTTNQ